MLEGVAAVSSGRMGEVRQFLTFIETQATNSGVTLCPELLVAKGLYFVHLYSAFEFTVTATIQHVTAALNSANVTLDQCQPVLLGLALDPECKSMSTVGTKSHWEHRCALFKRSRGSDPLHINDGVAPLGIGTIKVRHLQRLWTMFAIRDPILPDMSLKGKLEEVTDKRMAISHGRESAAEVGRRFTVDDLKKRHLAIDSVCTHFVQAFDSYLVHQHYLYP